MAEKFGQKFRRERVKLKSGGVFDFDAVSSDEAIVATISTSSSRTGSGKLGVGKLMKLRSDMLFLMLPEPKRALVVLTEADMHLACLKERSGGRVPLEIEFFHAPLPDDLAAKLKAAKQVSGDEVTPKQL